MSGSSERVLLIGMMGAGKTTTGKLLAERLGWLYLDSDAEIERRAGRTVPEIWKADGEPAFRREESRVLAQACRSEEPAVVAVAGGAVLDPGNRAVIRGSGLVVWLRADVSTLARRVGGGEGRPLLQAGAEEALRRLYTERAPLYGEMADLVFDVDRMSPSVVADEIVAAVRARRGAKGQKEPG